MEEERNELPTPPRFRYKLIKIMTLTLLFLALFFSIGFTGLEATSSSSFCSSCHEMKPEFYTWKASTHAEVDCVDCHTQPGVKNLPKDKANILVQAFRKETNTFTAPIHMPNEIPNSACERCHNMSTRDVTPSGDLIIPHVKHMNKGIECIQCHSGIAHGKIADRKMTFQVDYDRWDSAVGYSAMEDQKFIKPDMDTCMECHKARNITLECSACHKTGMVPKSHKTKDFKQKKHGLLVKTKLEKCNKCHAYMSKDKIEGYFDEEPSFAQYLKKSNKNAGKKSYYDYPKDNSFCRKCHMKRPPSHTGDFIGSHENLAKASIEKCKACHEIQQKSDTKLTNVACSSCHPSSHYQNTGYWKIGHPIQVAPDQKLNTSCYRCHNEDKCSTCHTNVRTKKPT